MAHKYGSRSHLDALFSVVADAFPGDITVARLDEGGQEHDRGVTFRSDRGVMVGFDDGPFSLSDRHVSARLCISVADRDVNGARNELRAAAEDALGVDSMQERNARFWDAIELVSMKILDAADRASGPLVADRARSAALLDALHMVRATAQKACKHAGAGDGEVGAAMHVTFNGVETRYFVTAGEDGILTLTRQCVVADPKAEHHVFSTDGEWMPASSCLAPARFLCQRDAHATALADLRARVGSPTAQS